jgi:hypothetical protein
VCCQFDHEASRYASYTREIHGNVSITAPDIDHFPIGKRFPIKVVAQDLETVVDYDDSQLECSCCIDYYTLVPQLLIASENLFPFSSSSE